MASEPFIYFLNLVNILLLWIDRLVFFCFLLMVLEMVYFCFGNRPHIDCGLCLQGCLFFYYIFLQ
jgi:hypothetical protein